MILLGIYGNHIAPSNEGLRVTFSAFRFAQPIAAALQLILSKIRYHVPSILNASPDVAAIEIESADGVHMLTDRCLREAAELVMVAILEFQQRYSEAVYAERAVMRKPLDAKLEVLNRMLWQLQQENGRALLAPCTPYEIELRGVDPQLLRAAKPNEGILIEIQRALVAGCREIELGTDDLFRPEDEVDVLVSLRGAIPEVQLRTTRSNAQDIYRKKNRLTASARAVSRGAVPVVLGDYLIEE
jgi:hypothetical protein